MKSDILKKELYEYISNLEIVDCHEHLIDEKIAVERKVDFSLLVSHYNDGDFLSAGMKQEEYKDFYNPDTDLERKWQIYEKWYPYIEDSSYMKATKIVLKHNFDVDAFTKDNYGKISAELQARKQPGYYKKVFRDCGIKVALNNDIISYAERFKENTELLKQINCIPEKPSKEHFVKDGYFYTGVTSVADLHSRAKEFVSCVKKMDNKGFKLISALPYMDVSEVEAAAAIQSLLRGEGKNESAKLFWYVLDQILKEAAKVDLPIAIHTGYWGNYREHSPEKYIPLIQKHPDNRFDLFHLGYPYVKQSLMLAKSFPNVCIDLCWTYIISQQFAKDALCQIIDFVPRNKVFGFGGDLLDIERVYGHRVMMNETMSCALAAKVDDGTISLERAKIWARSMLVDNPKTFYAV